MEHTAAPGAFVVRLLPEGEHAWQGSVTQLGGKAEAFHSSLELIGLIERSIGKTPPGDGEVESA